MTGADVGFYALQFLTGLASAAQLFLVASGLTLIFGVTRIVNFAHGSLYMLGAYIGFSLTQLLMPVLGDMAGFWVGILGASVAVGLIGVALEIGLLRRIYAAPELFQLIATFAVVLVIQDVTRAVWGPDDLLGPRAPGLTGSFRLPGGRLPTFDLFLILLGPVVLAALWLIFHRTRWGILVRAATQDREMVTALGTDQRWLFTSVLFVGAALAGLGGALTLPREAANLGMDLNIVAEAFVVTVVGGMGSVTGAFLAAALIGVLSAFGILWFPEITLVTVFLIMAVVLIARPRGLMGKAPAIEAAPRAELERPMNPASPLGARVIAASVASLAVAPLVLGDYGLTLLTETLILALFAQSLHLILGPGGIISFGHAAFFGLGAYGAALAATALDATMVPALAAGPIAAFAGAALVGALCLRLSGVYLAMLTLAFAQVLWSVATTWLDLTGGDNGIGGVWPPDWAAGARGYYPIAAIACVAGILVLRRVSLAPFGYALRAGRDAPLRAVAGGLDHDRHRWAAFTLAGAFAGLAGSLQTFAKGSVFPTSLEIPLSVDALVMVLLGGVGVLSGPIVGATTFHLLEAELMASEAERYWRLILGLSILAMVLAFPGGLAGAVQARLLRSPTTPM